MYPPSFDYYRAESVEEALELMDEHADEDVEILAGGHSLLPTMKNGLASPDALIDIGGIDSLKTVEADDESVSIGALVPYAEVAGDDELHGSITAVAEAAAAIGDIQVRNRGTVGGNLAHSDPASDLPAAVLASEATIHAHGPDGTREIAIDEFFGGMYMTDLADEEILTGVEVPTLSEEQVGAYVKKASPSSGYAMVGVAAVLSVEDDTVTAARVAANGAFDHAQRLSGVEETLVDGELSEDLAEDASERATEGREEWEIMDDLQASSSFRAKLLEVYTRRTLEEAFDRAADRAAPTA